MVICGRYQAWLDDVTRADHDVSRAAFSGTAGTDSPTAPLEGASLRPTCYSRSRPAGSCGGRDQDRAEFILRSGGIEAVGLGQVSEASSLQRTMAMRHVGQAGEIVGQVTAPYARQLSSSLGEVAARSPARFRRASGYGPGPDAPRARSRSVPSSQLRLRVTSMLTLAGLEDLKRSAVDAHRSGGEPAEVRVAVPFGAGEVDGGTACGARCGHGPCR